MKAEEHEILRFVEPVFQFCVRRVGSRADAEDLASEILLHVLDGLRKYEIGALEAWVWRIAHNRYARFCAARKTASKRFADGFDLNLAADYTAVDEESVRDRYEIIFRALHTLAAAYKNILVDYYIGGCSVGRLAAKYGLPETTVKWRLHAGRQKIRERIEEKG